MRSRAAASASSNLPASTRSSAALDALMSSGSSSESRSRLAKNSSFARRCSTRRASSRLSCSLTSSACSAASSVGWQHFLYFLPLPQWQGSLRPGLAILGLRPWSSREVSLYSTLLGDATFHNLLLACDRDITNQVRRRRCLLCRSSLHSANYPRKPRGRLCRLPPEHDW